MTGWRNRKDPSAIPKAIQLRERARALKANTEDLLKKADALLLEAERMEAHEHYNAVRPELGERFANAVVETAEAIAVTPPRFALVDKGRRRAGVR